MPKVGVSCPQMNGGYSGMMSFEVEGGAEAGIRVLNSLKIINLAVSLGTVVGVCEDVALSRL